MNKVGKIKKPLRVVLVNALPAAGTESKCLKFLHGEGEGVKKKPLQFSAINSDF